MAGLPDELRLALLVAISALIVAASYRFSRRFTLGDWTDRWLDSLLGLYLVQYIAVGVCGVLGILSGGTILIAGAGIGVITLIAGRGAMREARTAQGRWILVGGAILVVSYLVGLAVRQGAAPPFDNDSLTYHLPAAVTWMQHGRIVLFDTWFHNPANTYSPLAGSMFITWLLAPLGNDALARFVQAPALVLIWLAMVNLCRRLGAPTLLASLVACSAVLSRTMLVQSILQKDDLFVTAFFLIALLSITADPQHDRLAPWRSGVAIGLLLATKYTMLLSIPILLIAVDAIRRSEWRVRHVMAMLLIAVALAGPWYLRNAIDTGNPIYPLHLPPFDGLFSTARSSQLTTLVGIWQTLAGGYYSVRPLLWVGLLGGWALAVSRQPKRAAREPLTRTAVLGPILGIGLFVILSPYDEIRFIYPSLMLLWACTALAPPRVGIVLAGSMLGVSLATNFIVDVLRELLPLVGAIAAVLTVLVTLWHLSSHRWIRTLGATAAFFAAFAYTYIHWHSYLQQLRSDSVRFWAFPTTGYGDLPEAWRFVRDQVPADATLAYAGTSFVYPLYGWDLHRRVIHVSPAPRVRHPHDLAPLGQRLRGDQIAAAVHRAELASADWRTWPRRLGDVGASYLLVARSDYDPPLDDEMHAADRDPGHFHRVFENSDVSIYQIVR